MKRLIILLCYIGFVQPLIAQEKKDFTVFHRLLVFNENQELMVVKIKNTDFWVTPGLYQNQSQWVKEGLDSLAATYGISITPIVLKGLFMLKSAKDQSLSLRNVFTTNKMGESVKKPDNIDEIRWLSVVEATKLISFPHINRMIVQITEHPEGVWGGSLLRYKEGPFFRTKVLEDFYRLY